MTRADSGQQAAAANVGASTSAKPAKADQKERNNKSENAASAEQLSAVDRKAALQVLQAVEAKCVLINKLLC